MLQDLKPQVGAFVCVHMYTHLVIIHVFTFSQLWEFFVCVCVWPYGTHKGSWVLYYLQTVSEEPEFCSFLSAKALHTLISVMKEVHALEKQSSNATKCRYKMLNLFAQ